MSHGGTPPTSDVRPVGWPHVLIIFFVMATLGWIVFITIDNVDDAGDVAAVLATIVPGIAAVGAAVFGIPLAYQTGKAGKDEAVRQSREATKHEIVNRIRAKLPPRSGGGLESMAGDEASRSIAEMHQELDDILASSTGPS